MELFIQTHGDDAQSVWEEEACTEHGGIAHLALQTYHPPYL